MSVLYNDDILFKWINKQPGIQKFLYLCNNYQDIYD